MDFFAWHSVVLHHLCSLQLYLCTDTGYTIGSYWTSFYRRTHVRQTMTPSERRAKGGQTTASPTTNQLLTLTSSPTMASNLAGDVPVVETQKGPSGTKYTTLLPTVHRGAGGIQTSRLNFLCP